MYMYSAVLLLVGPSRASISLSFVDASKSNCDDCCR